MQRYFDKFPKITYKKYTSRNITLRSKLLDKVYNSPDYFESAQLSETIRPDNLADSVYGDAYMSWLVYLSNDVIDPYYDWKLSQYDFDQFIIKKYGSVQDAQNKVAYWINNWFDDSSVLSIETYNALSTNTITSPGQQYYEPIYDGKKVIEYRRKQIDWSVNTNEIWEYSVSKISNSSFSLIMDEKVDIKTSFNYPSTVANAQVMFANSSVIRVQHVFGLTNSYPTYLEGHTSKTRYNVTGAKQIAVNIDPAVRVFWSPMSFYDVEEFKNAKRESVKLLSNTYALKASLELTNLLKT